jgi:hypothetical protein
VSFYIDESESEAAAAVPPPPVPTPDGDIILDASAAQTLEGAATTTSTAADPPPANDDMEIDGPERDPFEGLAVNPALRRKIIAESKTPADLEHAVWRLKRLSEYEFVRANNVTRNTEMIASLGLNKTFEEALGLPSKKAGTRKSGQKSGGRGGGGRKAKRARGEGGRLSSEEEDDEEDEEEEEEREPRPAREKRAQPTPEVAAPKEWAKKARAMLKDINFGLPWTEVIDQWWLQEQRKGFVSLVSYFFILF